MNEREASALKKGDRVIIWKDTPDECTGVVTEMSTNAHGAVTLIRFKWDDNGKHSVIHACDMEEVEKYEGSTRVPYRKQA